MDLTFLQLAATVILAGAGVANYVVLQAIKLEVTKLSGEIKEWARKEFADTYRVDRLEKRVDEIENHPR